MKTHDTRAIYRRRTPLPRTPVGTAILSMLAAAALAACEGDRERQLPPESQGGETEQSQPASPANSTDQSVRDPSNQNQTVTQFAMIDAASAEIEAVEGGSATGKVVFKPDKNTESMRVVIELEGLEPGPHGFHIHENDACWDGGEFAAGDHFNPYDARHGGPKQSAHHVGDMGNITADEEGRVDTELTLDHLAFSGPASILQRAVVIHGGEDDLKSQPSGDAGSPVACGVIWQESEVAARGSSEGGA